jgi:hypothetical protein
MDDKLKKTNPIYLLNLKLSDYHYQIINHDIFIEDRTFGSRYLFERYTWKEAIKKSEEFNLFNLKWEIPNINDFKNLFNTTDKFDEYYWTIDEWKEDRRCAYIAWFGSSKLRCITETRKTAKQRIVLIARNVV